jgi:hypothetical protein
VQRLVPGTNAVTAAQAKGCLIRQQQGFLVLGAVDVYSETDILETGIVLRRSWGAIQPVRPKIRTNNS